MYLLVFKFVNLLKWYILIYIFFYRFFILQVWEIYNDAYHNDGEYGIEDGRLQGCRRPHVLGGRRPSLQ